MDIAKKNKRIEFGKLKRKTNDNGIKEFVWEPCFKAWASAENLYGKEFWAAKAEQEESVVKFKCRYNSKIVSDFHIKFQSNIYEIIGEPDDIKYKHVEIEIKAKILERERLK